MEIKIAKVLGFCFGVQNAYDLAIKNASYKTGIMGHLVHNQDVQDSLYNLGIKDFYNQQDIDKLILRSHGTPVDEMHKLEKKYELIDTTCPVLKSIYNKIVQAEINGYTNIILGDKNHPEIIATKSRLKNAIVINSTQEVDNLPAGKYYVTMQTTFNDKLAYELTNKLEKKFGESVIIKNTICNASNKRREALYELMREVEAIIVFGSTTSNNTKELCNILKENNFPYYFANNVFSLDLSSISMYNSIGITAGASTPDWIIREAVRVLNDIDNKDIIDLGENNVASELIVAKNDPNENQESNLRDVHPASENTVTDSNN
ncbi:MAG: 4-hydroxy-3-methylbut-2-enyl diphosphate reductase [Ezakiella sp.]|nr:4-hydroxy-3-methylbut-2-enyl diphosphate reductase [Ezakiella sp.]MDD7471890.1 4-hydroxy-3-methylbut-2-enyl diphosphate reductase [Bacillota bacterium]MDY3923854.1 4-hydroxy-3-methylbut-2-enyl diphosphate reductase [Ezakiella sp.]